MRTRLPNVLRIDREDEGDRYAKYYLYCEVIELISSGRMGAASKFHLSFGDHVHKLNAGKKDSDRAKRFEYQHGPCASLEIAQGGSLVTMARSRKPIVLPALSTVVERNVAGKNRPWLSSAETAAATAVAASARTQEAEGSVDMEGIQTCPQSRVVVCIGAADRRPVSARLPVD